MCISTILPNVIHTLPNYSLSIQSKVDFKDELTSVHLKCVREIEFGFEFMKFLILNFLG